MSTQQICRLLLLLVVSGLAAWLSRSVVRAHTAPQERGQGVKPPSATTQLPVADKRFALVVGIDKYASAQITPLGGAERDAETLADALSRYAGFPKDQVVLLTTAEPARQPRRSVILRYLTNLRGQVPPDGLLLIAFAGHGIERGGRAFLLPSDAEMSDDISLLEDTAISVDRMRELIGQTKVRQVMLILDACRNDPSAGRSGAPNLLTNAFRFDFAARNREVEAFVTLYATAVGQRAFEYAEKRQGYFTWALIEGLKGAAANEKGEVTLGRLKQYVEESVPRLVKRDYNLEQRPFAIISGFKAEELVVAVAAKAGTSMPTAPDASQGMWNLIANSSDPQVIDNFIRQFCPSSPLCSEATAKLQKLRVNPPAANSNPSASPPGNTGTPVVVADKPVRVAANEAWADTLIQVKRGQDIWIKASGQVNLGAFGYGGPDGISRADARKPFADCQTGALLARIGNETFCIGAERRLTAAADGRLTLGLNESNLADNNGALTAKVVVQELR
jgi:hypothetical protein